MSNPLHQLYKSSLILLTDFYQLTMAYGYWQANLHEHEAVFYHSFRKAPFAGGYAIAAGLDILISYLTSFHFSSDDIHYLSELKDNKANPLFSRCFLDYLRQLTLSCDIDAVEEGSVVFAKEPLLRIKGPLLQCQLLESIILNILNFQTLIATSAARIIQAAGGEPVLEFGLRRAQGFDGALMASRAAFIGGCCATSNVLAGKLFNIPVKGTHAHSWVLSFESELEAFRAYAKTFPNQCIFLVDTYNTSEGIKNAIKIADELKPTGFHLAGVRLDSGDLAYWSKEARSLLDAAGYKDSIIVASNDLNATVINSLKGQGAQINTWAVGTHLITAYAQPALEGVYKLSAIKSSKENSWTYKVKLSEQAIKISTPGILCIRRFYWDSDCKQAMADVVYDEQLGISNGCTAIDPLDSTRRCSIPKGAPYRELMQPIFRKGKLIYSRPSLASMQKRTQVELKQFDETIRRLLNPHQYPVGLEKALYELKLKLVLKAKGFLN